MPKESGTMTQFAFFREAAELRFSGLAKRAHRSSLMNTPPQTELPDLFLFNEGGRVCHHDDWRRRRTEISEAIVRIEYGGMPPSPSETLAEELNRSTARIFLNAMFIQYRVSIRESDAFGFRLDLLVPVESGTGPVPVMITGDDCWRQITDGITLEVLKRGMALARFSRAEIVPDRNTAARQSGLYRSAFPGATTARLPPGRGDIIAAWMSCNACRKSIRGASRWQGTRAEARPRCWREPPTKESR